MPSEEKMPINEQYKYLRRAQKLYPKATRQERIELLGHRMALPSPASRQMLHVVLFVLLSVAIAVIGSVD